MNVLDRNAPLGFRDARNLAGWHADILEACMPHAREIHTKATCELAEHCLHLAREFQQSPRTVLGGARRDGYRKLYGHIVTIRNRMEASTSNADDQWYFIITEESRKGDLHRLLRNVIEIPFRAMEPRRVISIENWRLNTDAAADYRVTGDLICKSEMQHRFKDLTDRKRGKNRVRRRCPDLQEAFEAAWSIGNYELAQSLLKKDYG